MLSNSSLDMLNESWLILYVKLLDILIIMYYISIACVYNILANGANWGSC